MNQPEREAFIAALLAGELSPTDPQVAARLRADPELRIMIERMREVEAAAVRAAGEEHEVLREARAGSETRFGGHVTAAVQQVVAERQRVRRRRWLAAAAVMVGAILLGWALMLRTPDERRDTWLGSDPGLDPHGMVDHYPDFSSDQALPPGGSFVLRIYDVVGGKKGSLLFPPITENVSPPWQLTAQQQAALPDEIWWELDVVSTDGTTTLHAHATRRRH
jgi:hypothetical protein